MILLDTHVLIWAVEGDRRLGQQALDRLANEALAYSSITAWELAMLVSKQRLRLAATPEIMLARATIEAGVSEVGISSEIALDAGNMSAPIHGDPGDRFLMATARILDCPIITADDNILAYAAAGHVKAIDARQ